MDLAPSAESSEDGSGRHISPVPPQGVVTLRFTSAGRGRELRNCRNRSDLSDRGEGLFRPSSLDGGCPDRATDATVEHQPVPALASVANSTGRPPSKSFGGAKRPTGSEDRAVFHLFWMMAET